MGEKRVEMEENQKAPYSIVYTTGRVVRLPGDTSPIASLHIDDFESEEEAKQATREIEAKNGHSVSQVLKNEEPWFDRTGLNDWLNEKSR